MVKILDLGCGSGRFTELLCKKDNSIVYGADIDEINIRYCNNKKTSENVNFIVSKAEELPFGDKFFDEIHAYEILEHVDDLHKVMNEIKRILKVDGKLFISVPLGESERILNRYNQDYFNQIGHRRIFDKSDLFTLFDKYNFSILKYKSCDSLEHFFWKQIFKMGIRIVDQTGNIDKINLYTSILFMVSKYLSDDFYFNIQRQNNFFKKILFYIGYPFGRIADIIFLNKKQRIVCQLQ